MAVTSNSYTGNGSTTQYSITFQYIATTDIKAQINGVATTAFSLANATTLQFNSAPANGAAITIYRETDDTSIPATFFAGSSIRSQDLNDNFTQTLYIGQETSDRSLSTLGGTMSGDVALGQNAKLIFEGSAANANETTLTVTNPTADRTITLPNVTGTVVTTGDSGTVTSTMIADGTIAAADLASNSVTTAKIVDANVTTAKIADSQITSAKIADGTIVAGDLASNSVTTVKVTDANITTAKIADSNVTTAKIADNAITNAKMADNSVNSAEIAANAVTASELADNAVDTAAIADNAITSAKIVANAVTSSELADNAVDTAAITNASVTSAKLANSSITNSQLTANCIATSNIADNAITAAKINANAVDTSEIKDDAVTVAKIADTELSTLAGMQSGTASVLASSTALTSTTAELNQLDGKTVTSSFNGGNSNDIPTSSAINSHFISLINSLGGFVAISNEVSFPNTNPDPSDNAGTVVSIQDAGGVVINGSGVSTTGRTVGGSTVTINGFPSSLYSKTLAADLGLQVQTTSTLNTYTYHKLIAKEADVEQLSTDINDFAARYRVGGSNPTTDLDNGDLFFNTGTGKMLVYNSNNTAWEEVQSVGNFFINTISSYSGTGGNSATFNGSAYRFVLSNAPTNAEQLLVSINGVVQKPTAGTSQPAEGFSIDGSSILFSSAPPSGSDWFIITIGSTVNIGTPSNNTVSTATLQNGAVTGEKIATNLELTDNKEIRFGTSNDLSIYHDGTDSHIDSATSGLVITDTGGYMRLKSNDLKLESATNEDYIACTANGSTSLFYDDSEKIRTTSTGATVLGSLYCSDNLNLTNDNKKINLGDSSDLQIYHDGSHSIIEESGTGALKLVTNSSLQVRNGDKDTGEYLINANVNGSTTLYYDGVSKVHTNASGVDIGLSSNACHLMLFDGGEARFGTGQDLVIKHTSTNSLIKHNGTGDLYIDSYNKDIYIRTGDGSSGVVTAIDCQNNGAVNLHHSGSLRALTTANGLQVEQSAGADVEFRIKNSANTNASATNYILSEHDGRTTAKIVFGRNNDANDFSASAGSTQGDIQFYTTASGTTTKRANINNTGYFHADGDSGSFVDCSSNLHAFRSSTSNWALRAINSHASTPYGVHAYFNNSDPDTGNYPFFQGQDQTGTRFRVQSNGNVENHDNSYGSLSDVKLKENIVDAGSQWEDIKAIKVRNFNFKTSKSKKKLLGVVAQELETTSPGLVVETPDEDLEHNDLGTTTKSVRYSILYMKSIKALQEAMAKIETLETKVAALEAK